MTLEPSWEYPEAMSTHESSKINVELIDEETTFSIADLCRSCSIEAEFIEEMVEHGILEPTGQRGRHWTFPFNSLRRTRITVRLRRDLGVNLAGAALALELLERIEELDARSGGAG